MIAHDLSFGAYRNVIQTQLIFSIMYIIIFFRGISACVKAFIYIDVPRSVKFVCVNNICEDISTRDAASFIPVSDGAMYIVEGTSYCD